MLAIDETKLDKKFSHLWTMVGNTPCVTVLSDSNKKNLSTDLLKKEPVK